MLLLQGPFESDYSLAIVNRQLAYALTEIGEDVRLHQRDNTTSYTATAEFLSAHPQLAGLFVNTPPQVDIHSRYIYPPFTDSLTGHLNAMHCYGWEESVFPSKYVTDINRDGDLITVMSEYVRNVLKQSGVRIPIVVVGLGADHITRSPAEAVDIGGDKTFDFLHVSSCFPRKAVDVLLEAFCREFQSGERVRLIVKTFPNPHNTIEDLVRNAAAKYPRHPAIEVWQHSLSQSQMRFVYEHAGCVVAPSRGEGFGLPVAEAMMVGCPVIATAHGGHADICVPGSFWPIDFRIARANTHLSEQQSFWAEPSVDSLRHQMRQVFSCSDEERDRRISLAKTHVAKTFTWRDVARRHVTACAALLEEKQRNCQTVPPKLHIGFLSTWNTRCGIAEYTRYLISDLGSNARVSVFADEAEPIRHDEANIVRCWTQSQDEGMSQSSMRETVKAILPLKPDIVSLQFNFGFVPPAALEFLVRALRAADIAVFITMHSTQHPNFERMVTTLQTANLCIVHREADLERLMHAGVQNAVIQRQGILTPLPSATDVRAKRAENDVFIIACFGFFLPPKGIYELVQAFDLASRVDGRLRLKLLNALYPNDESAAYASTCLQLIESAGLGDKVEIWTEFLAEQEILTELAAADLIVLPYTHSTESSSAAIRLPIASMTPILCSDLPIFDEFEGVAHRYAASDPISLANKILALLTDRKLLGMFAGKQKEYVEELSWKKVADSFNDLATAYVTALRTESRVHNRIINSLPIAMLTT